MLPNRKTEDEKKASNEPQQSANQADEFSNKTGKYELYAVLTHRGLDADGGHYVAWIRQSDDPDDWLLFDDNKVTPQNQEGDFIF